MRKNNLGFISAYLASAKAGETPNNFNDATAAATTHLKTLSGEGSELLIPDQIVATLDGDFKENIGAFNTSLSDAVSKGNSPWGAGETLKVEEGNGAQMIATEVVSKIFNGLTANTEKFVSVFYPVFISKELKNSFDISFKDAKYITKWTADGYETVSALDVATDRDLLESRSTRIYPIVSDENAAILDDTNKCVVDMNGQSIESASYAFGKDINLIKSAQLGFKVAGIEDNISSIANTIWLEAVNLAATKDGVTAGIKLPTRPFTGSKFNGSFTGSKAEITLSFAQTLRTRIEDYKKADGTIAFSSLNNFIVEYKIEVFATGNLTKNMIKAHAPEVQIAAIYENDTKLSPSDTKYATIVTALGEISAKSFDLEVYTANTTLGFLGNTMIVEDRSKSYAIPFKTPTSVKSGIVDIYNNDTDATLLGGMISNNGDQISGGAITEFFKMVDTAKANHGRKGPELDAIGNEFVPAYYKKDTLDLNTHVHNMETQDMPKSVETSIIESLKSLCFAANVDTKIGAITNRATGGKLKFAFVGDKTIIARAGGEKTIFADDDLEISLVASSDVRFTGKLLGSVVAGGTEGGSPGNYFSCGFTGVVPTIVTEIVKTFGADSVKFTTALPRFDSITLLNFALELDLIGVDSIYTK